MTHTGSGNIDIVVTKYKKSSVKNGLDDSIKLAFTNKRKCIINHTYFDIRQFFRIISCIISGFLFFYERKYGYDAAKPYALPCVIGFFTIYLILILYEYLFLKNNILYCREKDPKGLTKGYQWIVGTDFDAIKSTYLVHLTLKSIKQNKVFKRTFKKYIGNWINSNGKIIQREVDKDIMEWSDSCISNLIK